jgi:hypothetical protein
VLVHFFAIEEPVAAEIPQEIEAPRILSLRELLGETVADQFDRIDGGLDALESLVVGIESSLRELADIERGFRVLKSEIEIGPVYHRLPQRIRAHAAICFMALILYRVMRAKLRAADVKLSPERALEKLRRIQHQKIILNKTQPITGLSTITQEHNAILATLDIKKPTLDSQMSLL